MAQAAAGNVLRASLFAVPVALAFHDVVGSPVQVEGRSMQPAINPHLGPESQQGGGLDVVWQDKLSISRHIYERGSIVVFRNPFDPKERVVKRLIGVDGDWVRPRGNRHNLMRVPEGYCWVEGDNHGVSGDSNHFGPIPLALIEAKATHVLWPPGRMRSLGQDLPDIHRGLNSSRA
ncbi:unnamed protein product [Ectocarpus sp. 12 AP-2014]